LSKRIGLVDAIDNKLHLLQVHFPYHESDHVLNFAYNALCGGTCMQDIELRRQDEVFLDAIGAERIPDPTTAGDFCRRFRAADINTLIDAFNEVRKGVWARQPATFFDLAKIDMDGTLSGADASRGGDARARVDDVPGEDNAGGQRGLWSVARGTARRFGSGHGNRRVASGAAIGGMGAVTMQMSRTLHKINRSSFQAEPSRQYNQESTPTSISYQATHEGDSIVRI
jgi:hypothetical protein